MGVWTPTMGDVTRTLHAIAPTATQPADRPSVAVIAGKPPRVPTSTELTGLEYRITGVFVKDNGTEWFPPFIRYSDLYVLTWAQSDLDEKPDMLELQGFDNVDDDETISLNVTPYTRVIEGGGRFPLALASYIAIVKSNRGIRDLGAGLRKVLASSEYKAAAAALKTALSGAASPAAGIAYNVVEGLAGILGGVLEEVSDRTLDVNYQTFTALNGDFDNIGKIDTKWKGKCTTIYGRLTVRGQH